jgi:C_GCAxxG_C_C family probable redox protein
MKNRIETAISQFDNGFNCAQSVLSSFCDELNLDKEMALKLSCGFGGGMGRKQEVCGAVTGGIIAIGVKNSLGTKEDVEITYSKTRELMDIFSKTHGAYSCKKLLKDCDLTTEEGKKNFNDLDLKNKVCKQCITTVVGHLEKIILK